MSTSIYAEHLTFDEQPAETAAPCACWLAGYGEVRGIRKDQVQHPIEFGEGWLAAFERDQDI